MQRSDHVQHWIIEASFAILDNVAMDRRYLHAAQMRMDCIGSLFLCHEIRQLRLVFVA